MNALVRRKLETADNVLEFCRAHASPDASYTVVLAHFEGLVIRGHVLAAQQQAGEIEATAAVKLFTGVKRELQKKLLPHLVTVGEAAAKEKPELAGKFALARGRRAHLEFVTATQAMQSLAQAEAEVLGRHGLADAFLGNFTEAVGRLEGASVAARVGRRARVGAGADLHAVTGEIMNMIALFHGLHRFLFRDDAERDAVWESVRNVVAPARAKAAEPPVEGGATSGS
ncbi:MAG: hypothetical protein ABI647_14000 [Gemmatimonadota bacterium]